jgi:tRNA A37 threonylcarbamoyladenosine synthetase subunit TsaC/SUA5/YrdC
VASTIVDATSVASPNGKLKIVRAGAVSRDEIVAVIGADRCE